MKLGETSDADKGMNPLHFWSDPHTFGSGSGLIRIPVHFSLSLDALAEVCFISVLSSYYLCLCCAESDAADDVGSRSNMRSVPGQTDLDESRDGGASQRTSGELSSVRRNDSPGYATDDQRPLIYIIPAIVAGLVLIIAGAVVVMYLWKRRQKRRNLGTHGILSCSGGGGSAGDPLPNAGHTP